ncbi:helix-turn-helix domain-containing protein [Actibacterium sp. 188UL27-1]|uniref:helix-turn-helix domain-containing protein n=1 Tax=Actibacterium sp. 188UL27-1 TaxID=2786961 RepID=UPI00195DB768|nr:helix-turn-helix transcriptional regulator [Actibacterium sp. 188UL27-1]MBM7069234.1 helix-turn-helix transcriptional regulator [Actibacterium sp. 188UL27-1]
MMKKVDKRDRADLFRQRLSRAIAETGISQAALARQIGVNRSTISQVLTASDARLPNAQIVGECAGALGVSADWLLGLSERPERAADMVAASVTVSEAQRALIDEQIYTWHEEAKGYKIRHVPATLPDMLKTRDMLVWEYSPHLGRSTEAAIQLAEERLGILRTGELDIEIAMPLHELRAFARAEGYYDGAPAGMRKAQLAWLRHAHDQFYPSLRISFYDAQQLYSAPITVFGPLLAVLYLGSHYLAFRDTERIRILTRHFDGLVREAKVSDRDAPGLLEELESAIP